ncbi:hypothetical protein MRB53_038245 [Persea americana]|nr:hypothetical protein MRB53_038245 [Persea americana]
MSILGSNDFTRAAGLDVPVQFSSDLQPEPLTISPGDLILGDADGVVSIPPSLVEQCLQLCKDRAEIDEKTMECLRNGDEMGSTLKKLRK